MEPTWVLSAPVGPHVGPMNLAIWDVSSSVAAKCDRTNVEYIADDADACHYWMCVHGIQYGVFPCMGGLRVPVGARGSEIRDVCSIRLTDYDDSVQVVRKRVGNETFTRCPRIKVQQTTPVVIARMMTTPVVIGPGHRHVFNKQPAEYKGQNLKGIKDENDGIFSFLQSLFLEQTQQKRSRGHKSRQRHNIHGGGTTPIPEFQTVKDRDFEWHTEPAVRRRTLPPRPLPDLLSLPKSPQFPFPGFPPAEHSRVSRQHQRVPVHPVSPSTPPDKDTQRSLADLIFGRNDRDFESPFRRPATTESPPVATTSSIFNEMRKNLGQMRKEKDYPEYNALGPFGKSDYTDDDYTYNAYEYDYSEEEFNSLQSTENPVPKVYESKKNALLNLLSFDEAVTLSDKAAAFIAKLNENLKFHNPTAKTTTTTETPYRLDFTRHSQNSDNSTNATRQERATTAAAVSTTESTPDPG